MTAATGQPAQPLPRADAIRLLAAAALLVTTLTVILGIDFLPQPLALEVGSIPTADVKAPRAVTFISESLTEDRRADARAGVPPQYDFTPQKAITIAGEQMAAFERTVTPLDIAFDPTRPEETRQTLLDQVMPELSDASRETLKSISPSRWEFLREEALRVLDAIERNPLRDSDVATTRRELPNRLLNSLTERERSLVAELVGSHLVPNSSFSAELTEREKELRAAEVQPVEVRIQQGQIVARDGEPVTPAALEALQELGLTEARPDLARLAGFFLLATLVVGTLLAWLWRFRHSLWHDGNILVLLGLLLMLPTLALKLAAGGVTLPFLIPTAGVAILVAILLDAGTATILVALVALIGGAVGGSLELTAYIFLGGLAGVVGVRRGDRIAAFVQAGVAIFVVNAVVVSTFSLLGARDLTGIVQLWGVSAVSAAASSVAAVGSFAFLGNLFGILTAFQLLELGNPSQPLMRRLLVETPGTYHHSLMVGNLAERAAEAIGADPLLTRVAAYYHDVGKLANPIAFIENQAGGENIHDRLSPEQSAQILKQHVAAGIDIAYQARLPKALIAFIPQHHGTAVMNYFYARARGLAAEPFGGPSTAEGAKAADAIDRARFRHAGPKPQTREAALIMLADGVEASVRSLQARDEGAIRAMVSRIIQERLDDGQFDECDLTLRDIERVREAFVGQLLGMYHQRIEYPDNKIVELESRRAAGGGPGGAS